MNLSSYLFIFSFLEKSQNYLNEAQQWTHPHSHEPQWFDVSNTVWKSITKVFIWVLPCFSLSVVCSMETLHWCRFSKPRAAPVSLSATYTTFSFSYSPFAPCTNLDESTFPWCLYRWELQLLSRCPKQQESSLLSFKIFWVGSLNSSSTYIFCSNLFAVSSHFKPHFLMHQMHLLRVKLYPYLPVLHQKMF